MTEFVTFTDKDGDPVHLKADTINGVYRTTPKRGAFLAHGNDEPAYTVVSATAGGFKVLDSVEVAMGKIKHATADTK